MSLAARSYANVCDAVTVALLAGMVGDLYVLANDAVISAEARFTLLVLNIESARGIVKAWLTCIILWIRWLIVESAGAGIGHGGDAKSDGEAEEISEHISFVFFNYNSLLSRFLLNDLF